MFEIKVHKTRIHIAESERMTCGSAKIFKANFEFFEYWDNLIKKIYFQGSGVKKYAVLDDNNSCEIPWECLVENGTVIVGVVGLNDDGTVLTTVESSIGIVCKGSCLDDAETEKELTPTLVQQMLLDIENAKEVCDSVREDANNGEFDGRDGKSAYEVAIDNGFVGTESEWLESLHGENGTDGIDGKDGVPGRDGKDGHSPYIGNNGNWYVWNHKKTKYEDTGLFASVDDSWKNTPVVELELEEDVALIEITQIDGSPFAFEEIEIYMDIPQGTEDFQFGMGKNNSFASSWQCTLLCGKVSKDYRSVFTTSIKKQNGLYKSEVKGGELNASPSQWFAPASNILTDDHFLRFDNVRAHNSFFRNGVIENIRLHSYNTGYKTPSFPKGTVVKVFGKKANNYETVLVDENFDLLNGLIHEADYGIGCTFSSSSGAEFVKTSSFLNKNVVGKCIKGYIGNNYIFMNRDNDFYKQNYRYMINQFDIGIEEAIRNMYLFTGGDLYPDIDEGPIVLKISHNKIYDYLNPYKETVLNYNQFYNVQIIIDIFDRKYTYAIDGDVKTNGMLLFQESMNEYFKNILATRPDYMGSGTGTSSVIYLDNLKVYLSNENPLLGGNEQ